MTMQCQAFWPDTTGMMLPAMHAYTSVQLETVCTILTPLSKQLVASEAALEG